MVDLRSDTVTRPGPEMRRAMAEADVGDDVFGDDPTVIALQERMATLFGKVAALFVPSGTMANQVALAAHTQRGDEVICDRNCHIFNFEVAAPAVLSGIQLNPLDGEQGVITAEQIAPHIRPKNVHLPNTRLIAIENTHNRGAGKIFPLDEMQRIRELASEHGLSVHLDGARLANAVAASDISFEQYASCADTVSMCFSKGLGAPVGSIVAGTSELIKRAHKARKLFGGGMRQAGILAAAAMYALDNHLSRLTEDHRTASRIGKLIDTTDGLERVFSVETNMVIFRVDESFMSAGEFLSVLEENGILTAAIRPGVIRMVTHLDVNADDVDHVGEVLATVKAS
ncbi:MAG: low-specificity L-threonine aldolase [bacterium]|nr:low-specificity L-threonine aldolase [bacterium]